MSLSIGIIGLPNVGKSTLFNALLKRQVALAANYPFATIEPNIGVVDVVDDRLQKLTDQVTPLKTIPATVKFVDIAGLVKGAHLGEGLGNQFLAHIREADALVHVLRAFEDENVVREGSVDPKTDKEIIATELVLADIQSLDRQLPRIQKEARGQDKVAHKKLKIIEEAMLLLNEGKWVSSMMESLKDEDLKLFKQFQFLTSKPVLYVYNVSEENIGKHDSQDPHEIYLCAKIESELSSLSQEEATEYLDSLGVVVSGLDKVIKRGYHILGLQTFFTAGPKEVRAWTYKKGMKAPECAGVIHTDFERGFISAEIVSYKSLIEFGSWKDAKDKGLLRIEGKNYEIDDGDVVIFRFSV